MEKEYRTKKEMVACRDGGHLTEEQTDEFITFSEQQLPDLPEENKRL
ncbi:hypothetical protein [Sinanaerobacter chloroacetimidivorans]|jgi:hypothetical protein|uniref:Uncharacterized protein n=1 Tax=Sinanaerobacter chloroacetimidivorans TaxID=2818044 RepID=A0A8J8B2E1_9FIRM|nr:hypothetical protein [Sinanaerobacter chloroacetimidivorans]MBR0597160.1 hypothetical protein [Sinanaerobacter chloroacetimidivorans]